MHFTPAPLHIPDGFLSGMVALVSWGIAILLVGIAVRRKRLESNPRHIPLMGIMAAFIFAAQMINFPVAGGTSGHLLGGALAAIVLGPWAGMLVMTSVIALQALLFQDGGLLAMGANILNMGLVTALIGFGLYRAASNGSAAARTAVTGMAAWLSVMAGALLTAAQLWLSGTSPAAVVFPAMLAVHALIGVGEATITVAALSFIARTQPNLITTEQTREHGGRGWIAAGIFITFGVVLLAPFASIHPDGLERVAGDLGFLPAAQEAEFHIFADYLIPKLGAENLSTILAGIIGVTAAGATAAFIGFKLKRPGSQKS